MLEEPNSLNVITYRELRCKGRSEGMVLEGHRVRCTCPRVGGAKDDQKEWCWKRKSVGRGRPVVEVRETVRRNGVGREADGSKGMVLEAKAGGPMSGRSRRYKRRSEGMVLEAASCDARAAGGGGGVQETIRRNGVGRNSRRGNKT